RIRSIALDTLKSRGKPKDIAAAIAMVDEPRLGTVEPVEKLVAFLDLDRREAAAIFIRKMIDPSPAQRTWAKMQIKEVAGDSTASPSPPPPLPRRGEGSKAP